MLICYDKSNVCKPSSEVTKVGGTVVEGIYHEKLPYVFCKKKINITYPFNFWTMT